MSENKSNSENIRGSVLIVGSGIGGIQAALDLANSGFKVYMTEKQSAIGGTMAMLDKTFPTGDCSMCMISPKLVETVRHLNIEIHTLAEVTDVSGEAGDFKVTIKKQPRFTDLAKCVGCGECAKVCPIKDVPDRFNQTLSTRSAVFRNYPQAVPGAFQIDKHGPAPCKATCPIEQDVPGYLAMIREGKYAEAVQIIRRTNPLPVVCGYACFHPCEFNCERQFVEEPLAIRDLKRFALMWALEHNIEMDPPPPLENRPEKVVIIGSGPAGLATAHYLASKGFKTTVLESAPILGGMMALGMPPYRMPRDMLNKDIEYLQKMGISFKTGVHVGKDITVEQLRKDYNAVIIATGVQQGTRMNIPGEELHGVLQGLDFLKEVNLGKKAEVGKKVAVIGGGNTALDTARTAWRMGAEVTIYYRRTLAEMPANKEEIEAAEEEGIKIEYLTAPVEFTAGSDGKVASMKCIRMKLGEPDKSGRRRPEPIPGSEYNVQTDMVILAIGLKANPDYSAGTKDLKLEKWDSPLIDPTTRETSVKGVFAAGDVVSGPTNIVEAMRQGKDVAKVVEAYLKGEDYRAVIPERLNPKKLRREHFINPHWELDYSNVPRAARVPMKLKPVADRKGNFDVVELNMTEEEARREASRCLECGICVDCWECVKACQAKAIDHFQGESEVKLNVGAIILAPGCRTYDPRVRGELGYGRYPNVVTSIQFERILSASGPYQGVVQRPSDGKHPKKVAWIQCVGSRDEHIEHGWCSSVCCMYATKQAIIAKEHDTNIEPTIFYMDLRAHGKDFDRYVERAKNQYGVRYLRSMISGVKQHPKTKNLKISYSDEEGKPCQEEFDMVVLSVGFEPHEDAAKLAQIMGIDLNSDRFAATYDLTPVCTSRAGIFVTGIFQQPKDIPETVMMGSAAAGGAATLLAKARGTEVSPKQYPQERDIKGEEPRIGVFVCHCGINIASTVDVQEVANTAKELPNVVYAENVLYACSQDTQEHMKKVIADYKLNRLVVASCTPRTHMPLFQETMKEAGLNPYLFEMANIREHASWVHMGQNVTATAKAKQLVAMIVGKSRLLQPLPAEEISVTPSALVLGGGAAGMTAALSLADQGFPVHLVERSDMLGGNMRFVKTAINGSDVQAYLESLIKKVNSHPNITIHLETEVKKIGGYVGNFVTKLTDGTTVEHGAVILATGGVEYRPEEYLYGKDKRVMTQLELENAIHNGAPPKPGENFVMIQCVGSRDEKHPYCSRICCSHAVKNAISIKKMQPTSNVTVLYRDMRTYGFREHHYYKARELGVKFIHYDAEIKPEVKTDNGKLIVRSYEKQLGAWLELPADRLVLSAAVRPPKGVKEISDQLKVPYNEDGFYLEAHVKLRPVDFASEGLFFAGLAHAPKGLDESIAQAQAAAGRAGLLLGHDKIKVSGIVSEIDMDKCAVCLNCVRTCPYDAPFINANGKVEINQIKCQGCGLCVATCPAKALQLRGFTDAQILAQVDAFAEMQF